MSNARIRSKSPRRAAGLAWRLGLAAAALLGAGCAPQVFSMSVANPARGGNATGAMQSFELPPDRQDHRYEVTVGDWTPSSLGFHIRLVNTDRCGLPSTYAFGLVDDRGRRYAFQPAGAVHASVRPGSAVHDQTIDGTFPIPLGADTRFVVLQIRPIADQECTAVDFRWDFQA